MGRGILYTTGLLLVILIALATASIVAFHYIVHESNVNRAVIAVRPLLLVKANDRYFLKLTITNEGKKTVMVDKIVVTDGKRVLVYGDHGDMDGLNYTDELFDYKPRIAPGETYLLRLYHRVPKNFTLSEHVVITVYYKVGEREFTVSTATRSMVEAPPAPPESVAVPPPPPPGVGVPESGSGSAGGSSGGSSGGGGSSSGGGSNSGSNSGSGSNSPWGPGYKGYKTEIDIYTDTSLQGYQARIVLDSKWDGWSKGAKPGSIFFTDKDGDPLYYWIEEWNPTAKHAVIWVKTDVNKPKTVIYMYWSTDTNTSQYASYNDPNRVFIIYDDFEDGMHWKIKHYFGSRNSARITSDKSISGSHSLYIEKYTGVYRDIPVDITGKNITIDFYYYPIEEYEPWYNDYANELRIIMKRPLDSTTTLRNDFFIYLYLYGGDTYYGWSESLAEDINHGSYYSTRYLGGNTGNGEAVGDFSVYWYHVRFTILYTGGGRSFGYYFYYKPVNTIYLFANYTYPSIYSGSNPSPSSIGFDTIEFMVYHGAVYLDRVLVYYSLPARIVVVTPSQPVG